MLRRTYLYRSSTAASYCLILEQNLALTSLITSVAAPSMPHDGHPCAHNKSCADGANPTIPSGSFQTRPKMPSLSNLSIRNKVLLAFGIVLFAAVALGSFSIDRLATVNGSAAEVRDNWLPATGWLGTISKAVEQYRARQGQLLLATTAAERERQEKLIDESIQLFDHTWRLYEPTVTTPQESALVAAFKKPWSSYLDGSKQLLE